MNCIAAALLLVVNNEEVCFFLFLAIINEWQLIKVFEHGLPDLLLHEYQFNHYAKKLMPELHSHFKQEGITTGFFMSRWFLTIFSIYLPIEAIIRVWDCVFLCKWKAIIKISLALMQELQPKLLLMDKARVSSFLRDSIRENYSNINQTLRQAFTIKVTNKRLVELQGKFQIAVAEYKLNNLESYFTDEEISALKKTKSRLADQQNEKLKRIQEIQKVIEMHGKLIENYQKQALSLSLQKDDLENLIDRHCEKKKNLIRSLEEVQEKHRGRNNKGEEGNEEVFQAQEKIKTVDEALRELKKEYIDKDAAYNIIQDSIKQLVKEKNNNSMVLVEYIVQNEAENEEILKELSTKLTPIALP